MKIWLFVDGPQKILKYIYEKRGINNTFIGHNCAICAEIFKDYKNMQCIYYNRNDIITSVMLKYNIILRKIDNDVEGFIRICSEKGYFNRLKRPEVDNIRKILQSNPELQKQIGPENASFVAFAIAVVVGVAAFVWAVTITHVMASNVVAVGTFHAYAAATTYS